MPELDPFLIVGVALASGLLIGLEREQSRGGAVEPSTDSDKPAPILGGVRTYPLFSLGGAICALLAQKLGPWILAAGFLAFSSFVAVAYVRELSKGNAGLTSEAAFLVSFLLGALAGTGGTIEPTERRLIVVASLAVVVTLLLSTKEALHRWVRRLSGEDMIATVKFLIVVVVLLPLLPDRTYGPFDVLNPYQIGWMVVLIAGVSFVGYVAVRALGPDKGLGLTGLVGGLASSTAVTLSCSGRARSSPELAAPCAMAVVLASTVMAARVLVLLAVVNASLVRPVVVPLGGLIVAGAVASLVLYRLSRADPSASTKVELSNPFELSMAIKFGVLFAIVLFASKAATETLGDTGTYLAGVLAGTTDVDAITLSMANLAKGGLDPDVAVTTVILGSASNTVVKGAMAIFLGRGRYARLVGVSFGAMIAAGLVGLIGLGLL